jgi:hypothetical protein
LKWFAVIQGAEASCPGTSRIAALDNEAWYKAVEDGAVVVAIEAVLKEVA